MAWPLNFLSPRVNTPHESQAAFPKDRTDGVSDISGLVLHQKLNSEHTTRKTPCRSRIQRRHQRPRWSIRKPLESPLHPRLHWLIDSPHQHPFPASSHSASERSGVASRWSNHNPARTDLEAHSQERFKAVKMSAWLKAQFERFTAARHEPASADFA